MLAQIISRFSGIGSVESYVLLFDFMWDGLLSRYARLRSCRAIPNESSPDSTQGLSLNLMGDRTHPISEYEDIYPIWVGRLDDQVHQISLHDWSRGKTKEVSVIAYDLVSSEDRVFQGHTHLIPSLSRLHSLQWMSLGNWGAVSREVLCLGDG